MNVTAGMTAILCLLAVYAREAQSQQTTAPLVPSVYDERLNDLDREAINRAYQKYIEQLFETWVRDPVTQPWRAAEGLRKARQAYIEAMVHIDGREPPKK